MDCPHNSLHIPPGTDGLKSQASLDPASETCFSTRQFTDAWSRSSRGAYQTLPLSVKGSGPSRTMYALTRAASYGRKYIFLGPFGLYGSPGWERHLERSTLERILDRLRGFRTESFVWNVRFDQEPLAAGLTSLGLSFQRTSTHVLELSSDYEQIFGGYNATIRNHIRKANRRGVLVRDAISPDCVKAYFKIHESLAQHKGNYATIHPLELFLELEKIRDFVRFLIAEYEGRIIAGGVFFRDGPSTMYWHGASDREYSSHYPSCAVLDEAVRWGCESGASFFNFGGSGGVSSLEEFKSFWGARPRLNWMFEWENLLLPRISRLKAALKRSLNV